MFQMMSCKEKEIIKCITVNIHKAGGKKSGRRQLLKYRLTDQTKKFEMGATCGTYGREERCIEDFGEKT
jgi:hypothetical protein